MPKLLLATPNQNYFSETFVRDHIRLLQPETVLYGGWRPYFTQDNHSVFSGIWKFNLCRAGLKRLFPKLYSRLYTHSLVRFIRKGNYDCILTEYGITATSLLPAAKECGVPVTCIFHGFDAYEFTYTNQYSNRYKELFEYAPRIICVSNDMKSQLVSLGCKADKIEVIPCGVDPKIFTPGEKNKKSGKKLLFIGRFTPKKNPIGLLQSFKTISEKFPDCTLVMAGDGELLNEAKEFVRKKSIPHVQFPGKINREQAISLMNKSDIYVQHSIRVTKTGDSEGTPVSILEAQAMQLPVVSTLHAGIKEAVLDGKTGFLVPENDVDTFAVKVIELLENRDLRISFGENARVHVTQNYTQELLVHKIEHILELCH
ncbi:MAG: glycosyltransferase [Bacteroidetes bacterium]|nr:glycosyltransferase [Bacteroidota bacterium]